MSIIPTLIERHTDATYRLINDTAIELLERTSPSELTMRAVAQQAGMSERTIFRYYPSREEFLDAIARAVYGRFETPLPPSSLRELARYPRDLYICFERHAVLVRATLHNEIAIRIRHGVGKERWDAVRELIDAGAPHRSERDRRIAAANVDYYLTATAWQLFRFHFGLPLADTILAAQTAVRLAIREIVSRRMAPARASPV
ncbi:MAG TPA: helix-turn-helix domain-containing protein [Steroidobacteraceae bacterium]|nr:helix-turn-helix domain-containing protein [Steroidobacteraceae bacterium]